MICKIMVYLSSVLSFIMLEVTIFVWMLGKPIFKGALWGPKIPQEDQNFQWKNGLTGPILPKNMVPRTDFWWDRLSSDSTTTELTLLQV